MSNLLTDLSTGLERVGREACVVLISGLNTEIAAQETNWNALDKDFAGLRGLAYESVRLEKIDLTNFHHGHKPSLIEAPITKYPNVCTMAYQSVVAEVEEFDQVEALQDSLFVEIMCKAVEDEATDPEELLNSRITRTADAVMATIHRNNTLNGLIRPIETMPDVSIMPVFIRSEYTASGPTFFWQGARLEYVLEKFAI